MTAGASEDGPSDERNGAEPNALSTRFWTFHARAARRGGRVSASHHSRVAVDYAGVSCQVIGRDALIANKRMLGRAKDLADLELLERHRR